MATYTLSSDDGHLEVSRSRTTAVGDWLVFSGLFAAAAGLVGGAADSREAALAVLAGGAVLGALLYALGVGRDPLLTVDSGSGLVLRRGRLQFQLEVIDSIALDGYLEADTVLYRVKARLKDNQTHVLLECSARAEALRVASEIAGFARVPYVERWFGSSLAEPDQAP